MIVKPRRPAPQIHLRLDADLLDEIDVISERTGRDRTNVITLLLQWAVEREKAELEMKGEEPAPLRKKREDK